MSDEEIIEYLRTLVRSCDEAIASIGSNDSRAKATIREIHSVLDDIAQQLRRRDTLDETMH